MHRLPPALGILVLSVLFLAVSCQSAERNLAFEPSPHLTQLEGPAGPTGRVLIAVPGAVRALRDGTEGPFLQVLVRVENSGTQPVRLDARDVRVVDEELAEYGPALPDDGNPVRTADPGEIVNVALFLHYPPDVSLHGERPRGLDVRVPLTVGAQRVEAGATLQRALEPQREPLYAPIYDPWYPSYYWSRWYATDHYWR